MMNFLIYSVLALNIVACVNLILVCRKLMDIDIEIIDEENNG